MKVRFGFVAMALSLSNASPSKTMTLTNFKKLADREAALRRITRIASENITNALRILKHAKASGIHLYRFSSKMIPLFGHEVTDGWDFIHYLRKDLEEIGTFIRKNKLRVSFHPDHFTLLNTPKRDVLLNSINDLNRHVQLFEAMNLDENAKLVIHVGGGYNDKEAAIARFKKNWNEVSDKVKHRLTLENDDRTYTAKETLALTQDIGIPIVLDIHHHTCNHEEGSNVNDFIDAVFQTWEPTELVPKIHLSSPKDSKNFRSHADFIDSNDLLPFLDIVREREQDIDIMIEAKKKDEALFQLIKELSNNDDVKLVDGGTILYKP